MQSTSDLRAQLEETDRKCGLESLYYMARFNLGYSLMREFPHKGVCRFAQNTAEIHRFGLDLEPRGSFKTTTFSQALPIWLIIKDPDTRILLDSVVLQNPIDNLGVIKAHFEGSRIQFLYGNFVGPKWTTEEITVGKRTRTDLKEPTIRCASVEKVQVGPHYDWIICDDLVGEGNIETREQRQKVIDHFRLLFSLLEPDGKIIVIGTRWHFLDLYNTIVNEFPEFKTRIRSAETSGPDGGLYFPERLSAEFLSDQKRRLGRDFYSAQYLNDPAPEDEHSKFQKSWFKRYDALPIDPQSGQPIPLYSFITVDPGGKKKKSDDWVFFVSHMDPNGFLYFDYFVKGKYRLDQAVDQLFTLEESVKPIAVGYETTAAQDYLVDAVEDAMRARNHFFHIQKLTHAQHSKESRIARLSPRYETGSILHSSRMGELEDQLRRFPKGADDIADAAASVLEVAVSPRRMKKKNRTATTVDDMVWQQILRKRNAKHTHQFLGSEF